jgi:hypothetical protein
MKLKHREIASYAATQEFPNNFWNLKIHCRVHKSPPFVSILSQNNPVQNATYYPYKIRHNIILPPTSRSS